MPALLIGGALLLLLVFLARGFVGLNPAALARAARLAAGIGLAALTVFLLVRGNVAFAIVSAGFALLAFGYSPGNVPVFGRIFGGLFGGIFGGLGHPSAPPPGQTSDVETSWLRMTLDHESGGLEGMVLQGPFKGRTLDDLALGDLRSLLGELRVADAQSAALLETWLDRRHGAAWREEPAEPTGGAGQTPLTEAEALEMLGLGVSATEEEIRAAHRELMKKLHPDQGGSTWFAAKANAARDLLLKRHKKA